MFFFENHSEAVLHKKNQKTFVTWSVDMLARGIALLLGVTLAMPALAKLPPHVTTTTVRKPVAPAYSHSQPSRRTIYHR